MGKSAFDVFPAFFEKGFAAFAFHGAGRPVHGLPGFGFKIVRLTAGGVGIADDGARSRCLLDDAQLHRMVEPFVAGEVFGVGGPVGGILNVYFLHQCHGFDHARGEVHRIPGIANSALRRR